MEPKREKLPFIRNDLKLLRTSSAEDGSKQWLLFDPIQNKYFTIGIDAFELLSSWQGGMASEDFLISLREKEYEIDEESLATFILFLSNNNLLLCNDTAAVEKLKSAERARKQNPLKWLIHNYLFIRIPLVKPDAWLEKNLHRVAFFYSKTWQRILLIMGFLGIVMVLREWESFLATFMYLFSMEGLFYYFLSLVFVKSLHELGHAFSAKRYGCRVPTMGVAFLVLFPVLYTDTTNAWMLRSKYQRLSIVLAGIKVELYLALLATFFYSFAPDGVLKSVLFIVATTSWISSLLINISPFLRFDGYYALADITESKNLQPRSFAMAKWFLRKNILGLDEQKPEMLSSKKERFFIIYALLTWLYRFFLFLGIAFLVYYFAFKVLGIILFLVEIVWFIGLPIYKELSYWYSKRAVVTFNSKNRLSLGVLIMLLALLLIPFKSSVTLPALLEAENYFEYYPPQDAKIKAIHFQESQNVHKGDLLLELHSPLLEHQIDKATNELLALEQEIAREASSYEHITRRFVLKEQYLKKQNELDGLLKSKEKLRVEAPFDGKVISLLQIKSFQWVNKKEPIFGLLKQDAYRVVAFCDAYDRDRLAADADATFISSVAGSEEIDVKLKSLSNVSLATLEFPELASDYGGEIATRLDSSKMLKTQAAYYKVLAIPKQNKVRVDFRQKGVLVVDAKPKSFVERIYKQLIFVLLKESSF